MYFLTFVLTTICVFTNPYSDKVYAQIPDITNPTYENYLLVENYLYHGTIPNIQYMIDYKFAPLPRGMRLVKDNLQSIERKVYYIKQPESKKDNCIYIYTPINDTEIQCAEELIQQIKDSDYKGHVIWQKGGFPNLEGGDLVICHLPHAYKLAGFREAIRLGYKNVLWMNCNLFPSISLKKIFNIINAKKIYSYILTYGINMVCFSNEYISAFNLSLEMATFYRCFFTGVIGLDITDKDNLDIIDSWYGIKENEKKAFTSGKEMPYLSTLLRQYYGYDTFNDYDLDFENDFRVVTESDLVGS